MKTLRRLGTTLVLTFVFGLSPLAGKAQSPACAPPDGGITSTPPCAAAQPVPGDPAAPGQLETPPAANTVDILSVAEAAMNLLLTF